MKKIFCLKLLAALLAAASAVCFALPAVAEWTAARENVRSGHIEIIGGADGPTAIFVTGVPGSPAAVGGALAALAAGTYLLARCLTRKKQG